MMISSNCFDILQPAQGVDRELEGLVGRHRRPAQLPGHHLHVLALDGIDHVQGGQTVIWSLLGSNQTRML